MLPSSFVCSAAPAMRAALLVMCAGQVRPSDWKCGDCRWRLRTDYFRSAPPAMRAPRPGGGDDYFQERWPSPGSNFKPGDWTCDECGAAPNFASRTECFRCGAPKPERGGGGGGGGAPEFRQNFEGTRCFVENLSFETDWRMLKDAFSYEGYPVVYASVSEDRNTGRSKGHGSAQTPLAMIPETKPSP